MKKKIIKPVICVALIWPFISIRAENRDDNHVLSQSELASVDRENAIWHTVRVEDDADTNLRTLRAAGFTENEVGSIRERLAAIWDVDLQRNYGWLSTEAIQRIEAVDKVFVIRLRALRLFGEVGIRSGQRDLESVGALSRAWQKAIQRELDYRELSEFRLMNSQSAKSVDSMVKGLGLNTDEFRTLCLWQQEYDRERGDESEFQNKVHRARQLDAKLDYWARVRDLLGDARFSVFLCRADPDFARMNQTLARLGEADPHAALDLWWIREKHEITRVLTADKLHWQSMRSEASSKAFSVLGQTYFASYVQQDDAYWLKY